MGHFATVARVQYFVWFEGSLALLGIRFPFFDDLWLIFEVLFALSVYLVCYPLYSCPHCSIHRIIFLPSITIGYFQYFSFLFSFQRYFQPVLYEIKSIFWVNLTKPIYTLLDSMQCVMNVQVTNEPTEREELLLFGVLPLQNCLQWRSPPNPRPFLDFHCTANHSMGIW